MERERILFERSRREALARESARSSDYRSARDYERPSNGDSSRYESRFLVRKKRKFYTVFFTSLIIQMLKICQKSKTNFVKF